MKKQEQKQIISLDEFDQTVSLHQLLPSGAGRGLTHLKTIVNSILHNPENQPRKPLSILIIAKQGGTTSGRSFIRALGLEDIREAPAQIFLNQYVFHEFFKPLFIPQSFLISDLDNINSLALKTIYEIISKGEYTGCDSFRTGMEIVCIYSPVIMTTHNREKIPKYFQEKIDHIIQLEDYTKDQLELMVLQRLKYCGIDYEAEKVLSLLVDYGHEDLHRIIRLLKDSITVMMSENRSVLKVSDIKKVMGYS